MSSPKKRRTVEPSDLREWANVGIAGAALLLAVVSFWTTARISGIEDYLRSEITRRNADLNSLSSRSATLEQSVEAHRQAVSNLQNETDRLLAAALQNERKMASAGDELASMRDAVAIERANLSHATRATTEMKAVTAQQARTLEVLYRKRVLEAVGVGVATYAFGRFENNSGKFNRGEQIYQFLQKFSPESGDEGMVSPLRKMKSNLVGVCPDLRRREVEVMPNPPPPDFAIPDGRRFTTQTAADAYVASLQAENERISETFKAALDAKYAKKAADGTALSNYAIDCVCLALADQDIGTDEICKLRTNL